MSKSKKRVNFEDLVNEFGLTRIRDSGVLFRPDILYKNLEQVNESKELHSEYFEEKVNAYLRKKLTDIIGKTSDSLKNAISIEVNNLKYPEIADSDIAETVKAITDNIRKNREINELDKEIQDIESRLVNDESLQRLKIKEIVNSDIPLKDNPIFRTEVKKTEFLEIAKLSYLTPTTTQAILKLDGIGYSIEDIAKKVALNEDEKRNLKLTLDLCKLTGDNLSMVKSLKTNQLDSIANLVTWGIDDWNNLISTENILLPAGETQETYIQDIMTNIEKTYPSQALFSRLVHSRRNDKINLLDSVSGLLRNNDRIVFTNTGELNHNNIANNIDWRGIGADTIEQIEKDLVELTKFSMMYKYLGIPDLINNKEIDSSEKKNLIRDRIKLLDRFSENNDFLDLRYVNFFDSKSISDDLNWDNISTDDRKPILNQLRSFQRLFTLPINTDERMMLLANGFDSANVISNMTEDDFIASSGLVIERAHIVYDRARGNSMMVANIYENTRDITFGSFNDIVVGDIGPTLVNDLRQIDGFTELFGTQNYCECEECRSILSPAAYFVYLMKFIERNISKRAFSEDSDHPLYLKRRRGDLWKLKLTCENTHTLIPYLTIVNEVLQNYLEQEVVNQDVFEFLLNAKFSFSTPFNLPFEEMLIYLKHFESTSLHQICDLLNLPEEKIWRARTNLSKEELNVIAIPDPSNVKFRFGNPPSFDDISVSDFIASAHISRDELQEILKIKSNPDIQNIDIHITEIDIQKFEEKIVNLTNERLDFIHRFVRLVRKTGWTIPQLDMLIMSLKESNLATNTLGNESVLYTAKFVDIQEKLGIDPEILPVFVHLLPNPERYFGNSILEIINAPSVFHHYAFNTINPGDVEIDPNTSLLVGSLGITENDLISILELLHDELGFDDNGDFTLDSVSLSLIYRHVVLAKSLKISVDDFTKIKNSNLSSNSNIIKSPDDIIELIKFVKWIKSNNLSVSELLFIISGQESTDVKYNTTIESTANMVFEIQNNLQNENSLDKLKEYLATSFSISSANFEHILKWISIELDNNNEIQTALNAEFSEEGLPLNSAELSPLLDFTKEVERIKFLFDKKMNFKLDKAETIRYITENPSLLDVTDIRNLTLRNVRNITMYKDLLNDLFAGSDMGSSEEKLVNVLTSYSQGNTLSSNDIENLAFVWQSDLSLITSISKSHDLAFTSCPVEAVDHIFRCLKVCNILGIDGYSLVKISDDTDFSKLQKARDIVHASISSKYDEEMRKEKLEPFYDKINTIKRDVFVDYIISRKKDLKFRNVRDLYSFFLLDVEMSGCFRTSRVANTISSLQIYVYRCLFNLEQSQSDSDINPDIPNKKVDPSWIPAYEWEWIRTYPLWHANTQVFLTPERFLEPDLRMNKTSLFRELEDDLLQQEVTEEYAENVYRKYITKFSELVHLKIGGCYLDKDDMKIIGWTMTPGGLRPIVDFTTYTYYLFGHTREDPPQYYYRKWINMKTWTPWEKIELPINSFRVAGIKYNGRLYIFWIEVQKTPVSSVDEGTSSETNNVKKDLLYSYLTENNRWQHSQRIRLEDFRGVHENDMILLKEGNIPLNFINEFTELNPQVGDPNNIITNIVYPYIFEDEVYVATTDLIHDQSGFKRLKDKRFKILFYKNEAISTLKMGAEVNQRGKKFKKNGTFLFRRRAAEGGLDFHGLFMERISEDGNVTQDDKLFESRLEFILNCRSIFNNLRDAATGVLRDVYLQIVSNSSIDQILSLNSQHYLIQDKALFDKLDPYSDFTSDATKYSFRISTSISEDLSKILFKDGLETLLSLSTQKDLKEHPHGLNILNPFELEHPFYAVDPFDGAYRDYYYELFLHIPLLIANHLNANQKFEDAKWWYERVFNPTADESPEEDRPTDRNWRFIKFRGITPDSLKNILTDKEAIEIYKRDPFNPHAIANLRSSSYQKYVAMKYIDNLLDWGDSLFAQDTRESIHQAIILYTLALYIIGDKPERVGECRTARDQLLTYDNIGPAIDEGSEFLITLENWNFTNNLHYVASTIPPAENNINQPVNLAVVTPAYAIMDYSDIRTERRLLVERYDDDREAAAAAAAAAAPSARPTTNYLNVHSFATQSLLAFCVPPNKDLIEYWNRVQDRLFKIHNCMNISGIRRDLALYSPTLNPLLLIKYKAAGLSLEDILSLLSKKRPMYKFEYMISRTKQFIQTVQDFGNKLLSALDRKDVEELTLLRSVHENNIFQITKELKKNQLEESKKQYASIEERKKNIQNRIDYYSGLLAKGLIKGESTQQMLTEDSITKNEEALKYNMISNFTYLIPQIGSPFALTFGGRELGKAVESLGSLNQNDATKNNYRSSGAGLESSFERRKEEWNNQLTLAKKESDEVEEQRLAAEIRMSIAQNDLEISEKNIEHSDEIYEFYKDKFTNIGLYEYLSSSLNRLYKESYNMALNLAKMCERSYQFECDDPETLFISGDNWKYDRSGLLAGERLLIQMQRMETAFIEQNKRNYEVTQTFSLAMINPKALLEFRQNASCEFAIPEFAFDLNYPGGYKRFIKSVSITIPCITGPYTNIGAQLTLLEGKVRKEADLTNTQLEVLDIAENTSIFASSGKNDSGLFELNFRDERYLPFEGAGAVDSKWRLELPSKIRAFDYNTISDVLIHISYTFKHDGEFKNQVEAHITNMLSQAADQAPELSRIFSLKHEFPNSLHKLLTKMTEEQLQKTEFEMESKHFPYFLVNRQLQISSASIYIQSRTDEMIDTSNLIIKVNNNSTGPWNEFGVNMKESQITIVGSPFMKWQIEISSGELDRELIEDIFLMIRYATTT